MNQSDPTVVKIEIAYITSTSVISMPTSASPKAWKTFDYATLDTSTSQFVQQQTGEIRVLMKRTVESIFEIGQRLLTVKKRLGHGRFGSWLETEFDWDDRTARRFMSVAENLKGKLDTVTETNFAPSALYILAAPSTPEAARDEAFARARAGESITKKAARDIRQKYASPQFKSEASQPEKEVGKQLSPITALAPASQPRIKQEIIAIRPPAQTEAPSPVSQSIVAAASRSLAIPKSAPLAPVNDVPGVWWQLGAKHLLYCGDPNSLQFLARIPDNLSLLLAFPPTQQWQSLIPANTRFIRTDLPQGKDMRLFEDTLESIVLLCSNVGEVVVSCFMPSVEILSIINRQDRRALLTEPDSKRVNAIISDWKLAGLKVERLG